VNSYGKPAKEEIMGYRKGDSVAANKDIGGVVRDSVPAGARGVVTETCGGEPSKVQFRVGNRSVEVRVNGREVR
jgi:hypothetical protein